MLKTFKLTLALASLIGAGCATHQPIAVPDKLKPGANEALTMVVPAKGVQIYECRAVKPGTYDWGFVAPDAELFDTRGNKIGKHYGGPHWESNDGSKVLASLKEIVNAPKADAIPWLLLTSRSVGPAGSFSNVTTIQRVSTAGGVAPKGGCNQAAAGRTARVEYTADYYFFAPK
jgi:hypothetical protein